MGVETRAVRFGQRAFEVIRDDLDQLLTSHLFDSVIAHLRLPISIGVGRHVTHPPRNTSRGLTVAGSAHGAAKHADSPRSARVLRTLRGLATPRHLEASRPFAASVEGSQNPAAKPPWFRDAAQPVRRLATKGKAGRTSDQESWDRRGEESVLG